MSKISKLEAKLNKHFTSLGSNLGKMESKHGKVFEAQSRYIGDSMYCIAGLYSDSTRMLFLKFIAQEEGVVDDRPDGDDNDSEQ